MAEKRKHAGGKHQYKRAKFAVQAGDQGKLQVGMLGVLVSHDRNKEKFCRLDSFKIFNHFAEKLYGPENKSDSLSDPDSNDVEKLLSKELDAIRESCDVKSSEQRRFSAVKSGCNNLVFIRFRSEISPSALAEEMVTCLSSRECLQNENVPLVRNVLRIHPVEFSCPAYLDAMRKNIPQFLVKKFSDIEDTVTSKEYNITFKRRNNTHLDKESVKTDLFKDIQDSLSGWKFNCRTDSVLITIDVICAVSLVSVVKDYLKFKKYNINQLLLQSHDLGTRLDVKSVDTKISSDVVCTNPKEVVDVSPDTKESDHDCEISYDKDENGDTDAAASSLSPVVKANAPKVSNDADAVGLPDHVTEATHFDVKVSSGTEATDAIK